MDSMYATLNGVQLSDLGIYIVKLESGMTTSPFLPSAEIVEDYAINNPVPYYYGTKLNPLELEVTFSKLEGYWTFEARREFANLLTPDNDDYMEFYYHIDDEPNRIYYVKYIGGIDITTNGKLQGYITVRFRCDSPFSYSETYETIYDLSNIDNPTNINFTNSGDSKLYPELWIEKYGSGDIKIKNLTNGGHEFILNSLLDTETVYINNEDGTIESSLPDTYRYDNHNGVYVEIVKGINTLQVTGACKLRWRYRFKIKG